MRLIKKAVPIAIGLGLLGGVTAASAQTNDIWRAGARVNVVASDHESVSAAGAIVSVRGSIQDDLNATAAELDVDATASEMNLAGAIVTLKGASRGDAHVAGGRVSIEADIGGELNAAGARVLVEPDSTIKGALNIAGADVVFAGKGDSTATVYGDRVRIDGQIAGDVLVRARDVIVGRNAVIDGEITFETFGEPLIEEGATIRGRQTVTLPSADGGGEHIAAALGAVVLFGIGAGLLLGVIMLLWTRQFVERAIALARNQPGNSLLVGLAVLILMPVLAVVIMVTIIGIPVGLLTLMALPMVMMIAGVLSAFAVSDWLLNRRGENRSFWGRLLLLLAGLAILTILGIVPFLGILASLVALTIGLGAMWKAFRTAQFAPRAA